MFINDKILIGKASDLAEEVYLYPKMANRHGLIAGATGTGKTITLKVLAESFSSCGVPVFLADAKGDLSGMGMAGTPSDSLQNRINQMGLHETGFSFTGFPATFWDVYQEKGIPLRCTISEMGPLLLGRILGLNDIQSDILTIVFKIADDKKLLLIDTKDLKSMLQHVSEHAKEYALTYGNIASQSVAAIIRAIVALEAEGGEMFFGEPALNITDWLKTDSEGKGCIQILDCQKLMMHPDMYATFLLWMLSELFEILPEVGDMDKPKLVFFFDEAHMLFKDTPKALMTKIEQVVKLIRSKGVGIYFVTQSPSDIPDEVLAQLGNKVQHALHAYTPAEQKKIKAAALSFRENPDFDTAKAITELAVGEALISTLDEDGVPGIVKRCKVLPPQSYMGMISEEERQSQIKRDPLYNKYFQYIDNPSAYEFLQRIGADDNADAASVSPDTKKTKRATSESASGNMTEKFLREKAEKKKTPSVFEKEMKKAGRSVAGSVGREIGNSVGKSTGSAAGKRIFGNAGASFARGIFSTFLK